MILGFERHGPRPRWIMESPYSGGSSATLVAPRRLSRIRFASVLSSDQISFEQQGELATHAERSNQQQAQKTLDVAIWGSSADVLMPSIAR